MKMENKQKILVLFAHPFQERSEANIPLFKAAQEIDLVTTIDLYREYPKLNFDVDREQDRLKQHDIIIFMFPLYWYSTPAILKNWQDLVLEYGFAYGSEGKALEGKTFFCALTAGGPAEAYRSDGYNHYTIRELLRPLEQMASLCSMNYLAPFALFSARTAVEDNSLHEHIEAWKSLLLALRDQRLDLAQGAKVSALKENLQQLIQEEI